MLLRNRSYANDNDLNIVKNKPDNWSGPNWIPNDEKNGNTKDFVPPYHYEQDWINSINQKINVNTIYTPLGTAVKSNNDEDDNNINKLENKKPLKHFYSNATGLFLSTHIWFPYNLETKEKLPINEIKGVIIWLHGLNAFGNRPVFEHSLATKLTKHKYAFISLDHSSFGNSEGQKGLRGYVTNFQIWTRDAFQYIEEVMLTNKNSPFYNKNLPFYIMAESLGGEICVDLCITKLQSHTNKEFLDTWKGVILLAPGLIPHKSRVPPKSKEHLLYFVAYTAWPCVNTIQVMPGFKASGNLKHADDDNHLEEHEDPNNMSNAAWHPKMIKEGYLDRDIKVNNIKSNLSDEFELFYHGAMRLSVAYHMMNESKRMRHRLLNHAKFPSLLIFHGEKDGVVSIEGSRLLYEKAKHMQDEKIKLIEIKDGYHNLLLDPQTDNLVIPEIIKFIES